MDSHIDVPRLGPRLGPRGRPVRTWIGAAAGRALPGLALCAAGGAMFLLAHGQPAWMGPNVGPGLMAQLLGKGVVVLGAIWAIWRALGRDTACTAGCGTGEGAAAQRWSGPALLGAVLVFALALPKLGLVVSATLAAALAAWGAGERSLPALALTVAGLGALTAGIAVTLLPPTAPLWPAPWRAF